MALKVLKVAWVFSLMGFMVFFIYIYASLPVNLSYYWDTYPIQFSRNTLFYSILFIVAASNMMVFTVNSLFRHRAHFTLWYVGQVMTFNLFFIVALGVVSLLNGEPQNHYAQTEYIIYGSVFIMVGWALGGLGFYLKEKR